MGLKRPLCLGSHTAMGGPRFCGGAVRNVALAARVFMHPDADGATDDDAYQQGDDQLKLGGDGRMCAGRRSRRFRVARINDRIGCGWD